MSDGDQRWRTLSGINVIAHSTGIVGPTIELEVPDYTVMMNAEEVADLLQALCAAELAVMVKVT